MTRIVILGGAGMLGHKMFQVLGSRFSDTHATIRGARVDPPLDRVTLLQHDNVIEGVDVTDLHRVEILLAEFRPDVIINCVGVIKQRYAAHDAITSITVNSLLPHHLAAMAEELGARLIHFSTDCVFSGAGGAYQEEDPSDAADLYGRTKYLGEVVETPALTLRTSIIGREIANHASLLEWTLAQNGRSVNGFTKALYAGLTTNEMVHLVGDLIEHQPDLTGLFHVAGPWISKFDLLCLIRDVFGLDIRIEPDESLAVDRTMDASRFAAATGYEPPSWPEMMEVLANDPTPYESWR